MKITISLQPSNGSQKLASFSAALKGNLTKGLYEAGLILKGDIKQKLSGPGHTRNPGTGNPYPGVLTNRLRGHIGSRMIGADTVSVGTNVIYAPVHEFGTTMTVTPRQRRYLHWSGKIHLKAATTTIHIPKRPFMKPAFEDKKDDVIRVIQKEIYKPIRHGH